jgi:hypothetical protein
MVTISVNPGDGKWREKTMTLSGDDAQESWVTLFPTFLDRAMANIVEVEVDDDEDQQ